MKVFFINSVFAQKSTGRICENLAEAVLNKGSEVFIAYGRGSVPKKYKDKSVFLGSKKDIILHGLKTRIFDRHGFSSVSATKKLVKKIEEENPDIIHLHNLHGYYLNIKILFEYLKKSNKKVIWTMHDCWAFTGHCAHYTPFNCDRWKEGCYNCPAKKSYPTTLLFDASKKNYKEKKNLFTSLDNLTIITPSLWLKNQVEESFFKGTPVKVINNGIDKNLFKKQENDYKVRFNLTDKKVVLGIQSAWSSEKGLEDFYKLSKILGDSYKIVLIGLNEKQIENAPKNVLSFPLVKNAEVLSKWYSASDVFVNFTKGETYPTVNLEAQAVGTPCITYSSGGAPETVPQGNVVGVGDIEAAAELILSGKYQKAKEDISDKEDMINAYLGEYGL